jgi:hypothetical protein
VLVLFIAAVVVVGVKYIKRRRNMFAGVAGVAGVVSVTGEL